MPIHADRPSERDLFRAASQLPEGPARTAFLDEACGGDDRLRERLHTLLAARQQRGPIEHAERQVADAAQRLASERARAAAPARGKSPQAEKDPAADATASADRAARATIGPYKLLEEIGHGGMGAVYMAQQTAPVRRKVALKIIKPGMDTREVIARFEAERQALAMMDHPHIARVLDAGATEHGLPYFVMELVRGVPITEFCRASELALQERLKLFIDVCRAVQHAHQKGIIHRDLKPSNILITLHDGVPVVKVIDFGVAKALSQDLTDRTLFTHYAQMIGTPLYMSPEQAELSGLDVDTRSDVYSLGVLLYELLTGTTPFERETYQQLGLDHFRKLLQDTDPQTPSARLVTLRAAESGSGTADLPASPPDAVSERFRSELDWVVMKALSRQREGRYDTAHAFAADIERFLNDEPVLACPPSVSYRLRKSIQRHKGLLTTACLVLATALAGLGMTMQYALRANSSAATARTAQRDAEQKARDLQRAEQWARRLLYAADMNLASAAIASGDVPRAAELLKRHGSDQAAAAARGFEWRYLRKLIDTPLHATLRPAGWCRDIEASPDGRMVAAGDITGAVNLYDARTWKPLRVIDSGTASVHGVAWSPDSRLLAAACVDGAVRIWDAETGRAHLTIPAHAEMANDVVFDPGGRFLFTGGDDNLAMKWDLESGERVLQFAGHTRGVERLALSPDGMTLATASSDSTFAVWDALSAERRLEVTAQARVVSIAFSPGGNLLAAGSIEGELYLADRATLESRLALQQLDGIEAICFTPDGRWLATADRGGSVQMVPAPEALDAPLERPKRWIAHAGRAQSLASSTSGAYLISSGRDGALQVWRPDPEAARWRMQHDPDTIDFAVGSGSRLYVAGRQITVWDLETRRPLRSFAGGDARWNRLDCSPDGQFLAAVQSGRIALFDALTEELLDAWEIEPQWQTHLVKVSPDGGQVAFTDFTDRKEVRLYGRGSNAPARILSAPQCDCIEFSPDGRWLAVGSGNELQLHDLSRDDPPRILRGHTNTVAGVAFSPDRTTLATVSHDRQVKVWRLATGETLFAGMSHADEVNSLDYSPDGRTLATAGQDGRVRLWHLATGQPLGELRWEGEQFWKVRFSRDGQRLVGLLKDSSVVVYDAASRAAPRTGGK